MDKAYSVILFDLWFTLIYGLTTDPVLTLQRTLSGDPTAKMDEEFLTSCMTLDVKQPARFLKRVAKAHGYEPTPDAAASFRKLLKQVSLAAGKFPETDAVLSELKRRGYRLGLISNLWPFGVKQFFGEMGLGAHFEHLIYSFEAGYRKPSPQIFLHACRRFNVEPEQCLMVGDSLESDVMGSLSVGMGARLVARNGCAVTLPTGAKAIASLTDLLV